METRRRRLDIDADGLADARRVQVSAVWAHDELGRARPMAWLSRIDAPRVSSAAPDRWTLPLWLDAGWFSATGLRPPLELRSVRVQDPDHLGVLASADRLAVPPAPLPPAAGRFTTTTSRLAGFTVSGSVRTPATTARPSSRTGLMLSHGYCSSGNPWPSGDQRAERGFSDPSQNRSHTSSRTGSRPRPRAHLLRRRGPRQGGNAALHLLTYYQSPSTGRSGRDGSRRRIAYGGTPLASLGFFACGVNDNLTLRAQHVARRHPDLGAPRGLLLHDGEQRLLRVPAAHCPSPLQPRGRDDGARGGSADRREQHGARHRVVPHHPDEPARPVPRRRPQRDHERARGALSTNGTADALRSRSRPTPRCGSGCTAAAR